MREGAVEGECITIALKRNEWVLNETHRVLEQDPDTSDAPSFGPAVSLEVVKRLFDRILPCWGDAG